MMIFAVVLSVLLAIVALAAGLPKAFLAGDIPAITGLRTLAPRAECGYHPASGD